MKTAKKNINAMLKKDAFSKWLGIKVIEIVSKKVTLKMKVRKEMLNGFSIAHGGITFSFADSALAFAANSYENIALAIDNSISYTSPVSENDILTAVARELNSTKKIGVYEVVVTNQKKITVAHFKGTVYRTEKKHT